MNNANKNPLAYLRLMLDAFTKIRAFTEGLSYEDFAANAMAQSAVLMQLQVVGELSKKVPQEMKSEISLPWKEIAGLRDMVSHDYFKIDTKAIWDTVGKNVGEAEEKIKKYLGAQPA